MSNLYSADTSQAKEGVYMGGQLPAHHLAGGQVWYLVHCKPNGEQLALRNLKNQDFPAFLHSKKADVAKAQPFRPDYAPCSQAICLSLKIPPLANGARSTTRGAWRGWCALARGQPLCRKQSCINYLRAAMRLVSFNKARTWSLAMTRKSRTAHLPAPLLKSSKLTQTSAFICFLILWDKYQP